MTRRGAGLVEKKQLQRRAGLKRPMQPRVSQGRCRLRRLRRRQTAKSGSSVAVGRECSSHPACAGNIIILRLAGHLFTGLKGHNSLVYAYILQVLRYRVQGLRGP